MAIIIKTVLVLGAIGFGIYSSGSSILSGNAWHFIPLAGYLIGIIWSLKGIMALVKNVEVLDTFVNIAQNVAFVLEHSRSNRDKAKAFLERLNVPHEQFKQQF